MIDLCVEGYCQNCPRFNPHLEKEGIEHYSVSEMEWEAVGVNTIITCENREQCAVMMEYLRKNNKDGR